jgi:hypothetical protein
MNVELEKSKTLQGYTLASEFMIVILRWGGI